jgi:hypothetical protein
VGVLEKCRAKEERQRSTTCVATDRIKSRSLADETSKGHKSRCASGKDTRRMETVCLLTTFLLCSVIHNNFSDVISFRLICKRDKMYA